MSSKNQQLGKQVETVKRIHKQLAEDFYPNLKNVSIAAAAFNKTQESNQKAFADYLNSLNRFANSAKTAEPEAKQLAKELMILIKHFRKIGEETSKLVDEFGQLTLRIQTNAENEVKVHKNLLNKYLKEQKTIHKDVEKRRKTVKDLEDFYNQKYEETVNYQAVRYRFFTEKHTRLLKLFSEVTKELSEKMESFDSVVDHQSTKPVESEAAGSEVTTPKNDVENGYIVVNEEENRAQLEKVFDDKQDDTIKRFLKEYQEENGTSSRNHLGTQSSVSKVESHDRVTNSAKRLENIYLPPTPPTIPKRNEENVQPLPKPLPRHYSEADNFEPIPQPKKTSTLLRNEGYVSIDTTSTVPVRKFVELDQPKTEQTKPQPLPRQPFTAADYGSILICITTYGAKSERQLSLNLGETAELIRCGQRGWVLLRTFSGLRIGWFPAKFVRFATDEEKLFDSQPS